MVTKDLDSTFLNEYSLAAEAAKKGNREKCKRYMEYFKEQIKVVTPGQIKLHFALKDLDEAITWYKIFVYSGYDKSSEVPSLKAMFSIIVNYIIENASPEQKHHLARVFIRERLEIAE